MSVFSSLPSDSLFSRASFSAKGYAAFRPMYPQSLFDRIIRYHNVTGASGTLVDLGCGPGQVARALSPHFGRVMGVDPSAVMVEQARKMTEAEKVSFRVGGAESLPFLEDASVDMVSAAQSAHWFDFGRVWPELARVVKSGGTLAIWGYKDNVLIGYPEATRIYEKYTYGLDEVAPGVESMERYWEQPGRNIIRQHLREVVPPESDWTAVERETYEPDVTAALPDSSAWLRKRLTLGGFESYVRTFSSYRAWMDVHPDLASRASGGTGDIVDLMFDEILATVPEWKSKGDSWRDIEVDTVWGTVTILAKRR